MKMKKLLAAAATALTIAALPMSALAAPKTMPDGNTFDPEYYAAQNPDVVSVLGSSEAALYGHYLVHGKAEGRLPYAQETASVTTSNSLESTFDAAYYASKYPDVAQAFGNDPVLLYQHYDNIGQSEGRYANAQEEKEALELLAKTAQQSKTASGELSQETILDYCHEAADTINEYRVKEGRGKLEWSYGLLDAAFKRAKELAEKNDKERPNGAKSETVLAEEKIYADKAAVDVAVGYGSGKEAAIYWMRDPSDDRDDMLDKEFHKIAVGFYFDKNGRGFCWSAVLVD